MWVEGHSNEIFINLDRIEYIKIETATQYIDGDVITHYELRAYSAKEDNYHILYSNQNKEEVKQTYEALCKLINLQYTSLIQDTLQTQSKQAMIDWLKGT